jgi:hypothetical protein
MEKMRKRYAKTGNALFDGSDKSLRAIQRDSALSAYLRYWK